MNTDYKKRQATRRKTLFPLSPKEVKNWRVWSAWRLREYGGLSFYAIRQVLKCSPDQARGLVARGKRLYP